jgi:predicted ATPase
MCHHLDGIALAIELAASRLGTHGVQGTAELLDNRFLWQGRRIGLPRHNTLHAMLDWSFNLLSERDRTILARLGVFGGAFSLAAVRAVAAGDGYDAFDVEQSLDDLVEKSLVWTAGSSRSTLYRLPHMTREFAREELAKHDDKHEVASRHARYVLSVLDSLGVDDLGAAELAHFALLRLPCVRAVLNRSFSADGDHELAVDLVVAAAPVWLRTGWLGECSHWSERALGQLAEGDKGSVKELALQEALATSVMFTRGNNGMVAAAIERGLALAEALGDTRRHLDLLAARHAFLTRTGALDAALEVARRSLEIAADLGCSKARVEAEWMLAISFHLVGLQKDALRHCDRGFALASVSGLDLNLFGFRRRVLLFGTLARCAWLQGRWDRGVAFARKAIQEAERGGSPVDLCTALITTAAVLLWNGSFDEAGRVLERLEDHADRHSLSPSQAWGLALRGELMAALGQHEEAVDRIYGALALLHEENHHLVDSRASRVLADSLMRAGDLDRAGAIIEATIDRAARSGGKWNLSELLRTQGEIRLRAGDADGAQAALLEAVAVADEQGALSWRLKSGEALARLWMSQGRGGEAHAEASSLLALLDRCEPSDALAAVRDRLFALRAEAERSAAPLDDVA